MGLRRHQHRFLNDRHRRGSTLLETTLIGIPMIFVLISIFEMARGMWIYHSLAFAAKEGARYASVHGVNCSTPPNLCSVRVSDIAAKIRNSALGLDPAQMQARLCINCGVNASGVSDDTGLQTINTLLAQTATTWPNPAGTGGLMHSRITFTVQYPFRSALSMFWPGAGRGVPFSRVVLVASAGETIHF
jgi:hypothetical protein